MRALLLSALLLLAAALLPAAASAQPPVGGPPVESYGCFAGGATFKVFDHVVLWECLGSGPTGLRACPGGGAQVVLDGRALTPCP
jgi:hypothetical protein